ncbi:MAG: NAD(P)-dependent oxidoreductase [Actinomycetes bacterium]
MSTAVAMIGLGRMGGPMADHVARAGLALRVHDRSTAAVAARVATGAVAAGSAADAARGASVVGITVLDDDQVLDVLSGSDGVLGVLEPGAVVAVHSTVRPATVRTAVARGAERGVIVLDAGISGGETGAVAGTLLSLVGGPTAAVDRARPYFEAFSKEVVHAGPSGAGMALKLARNATGYAWMAAVHEAMELAVRAGVGAEVLRHTIAETGVFEQALVPLGLGGPEPFPPDTPAATLAAFTHTVRLADKDLDHALELAADLGVATPGFAVVRTEFHRSVRL